VQCCARHLDQHWIPPQQHKSDANGPGDPRSRRLKQPEPLAGYDDEQHGTKDQPNHHQNRLGESCSELPGCGRGAGYRRSVGDSVARGVHSAAHLGQVQLGWVGLDDGLFRGEEYIHMTHARQGCNGVLDMCAAFGAVHTFYAHLDPLADCGCRAVHASPPSHLPAPPAHLCGDCSTTVAPRPLSETWAS